MRLALLLTFIAAANGFGFYVLRSSGAGVCITNEIENLERDIVPILDLGAVKKNGYHEERWTDAWQIENLEMKTWTAVSGPLDYKTFVMDGSEKFQKMLSNSGIMDVLVLAESASLLLNRNEIGGFGVKMYLDLVDPTTGLKANWAEYCHNAETPQEKCQRLLLREDITGESGVLFKGERWTLLRVSFSHKLMSLYRDGYTVLKWTTDRFSTGFPLVLSAMTHQKPGIFKVPLYTRLDPIAGKEINKLSRAINGGSSCLTISWQRDSHGHFSVINSKGGEVQQGSLLAGNVTYFPKLRLELEPGPGNDFRLELHNITNKGIHHIGPCPGTELKILPSTMGCTWMKPVYTSLKEKFQNAYFNESITVDLIDDELSQVCTALGFSGSDEPEPVKFCNQWGCNFELCPPKLTQPFPQLTECACHQQDWQGYTEFYD